MMHEYNVQDAINRAVAHHCAGRLQDAEKIYREILNVNPDNPNALNLLGLIAHQMNHNEEACKLISRAIDVYPDEPTFYGNLGTVLCALGRIGEAENAYRRAVEINDDFVDAHYNLANLCKDRGDFKQAEARYNKTLISDPGHAMAALNLANILQVMGRLDDAEEAYRRVIGIQPNHACAYRQLAAICGGSIPQDDLEAMEKLLSDPSLPDAGIVDLCYGLAFAYDGAGDYDRAFGFLERGSRIKRAAIDYDVNDDLARLEEIARVFDARMLAAGDVEGCPSDKPVFIVGMPRSGTSLVEHILASHSEVEGAGEVYYLPELVAALPSFPDISANLDDMRGLGEAYVGSLGAGAPDAARITDKMPINFQFIGLIHLALPNCRIINCVRNPVDTCLSCFRQLFTSGNDYSYDLGELGRYYAGYARLMEHWRTVLPGRIHDIDYETLVADPEAEIRKLLDFCGLPFEKSCLGFHKTDRAVLTPSTTQVRRPVYRDSVNKWRRYEKHLGRLLTELNKTDVGK